MADNQLLNDGVGGGGDDIFVYTGGEQQVPFDVKRVRIAENVDTIPERTFYRCYQLIEVEGHNKLKKVEQYAFNFCHILRRVTKMTGVMEIEKGAFSSCFALRELEFDKLEIIGVGAFGFCGLRSFIMPSIRRVGGHAFQHCDALTDAMFGEKLERIEVGVFYGCRALSHIVIPLKDNLIIGNSSFDNCEDLSRVDILDGGIHKTISSLQLESWRNEMDQEIHRINQTLPNIPAMKKPEAIQEWITRVLSRMEHYKIEHHILLKEATTLLELALWKANLCENEDAQEGVRVTRGQRKRARRDRCVTSGASIVIKNVLPFLALQ